MRTSHLRAFRHAKPEVFLYLVAAFVVFFCFQGVHAVLLNLYVLRLGHDAQFAGAVNAAGALGFALFAIPSGMVGTRLGYRRSILLGLAANIPLTGLLPCAIFARGVSQRLFLLVPWGIYGFSLTLILVNGIAFLSNASTRESRPTIFALYGATVPIAGFFGCLVGGFLPGFASSILGLSFRHPASYALSLVAAPLAYAAAFLLFLRAPRARVEAPAAGPSEDRLRFPIVLVATFAVVNLLRTSIDNAPPIFFNVYMDLGFQTPAHLIGAIMSAGRLLAAPAALLSPVLARRIGTRAAVVAAGAAACICVLPIALVGGPASSATSLITSMIFVAIANPAYNAFSQGATHPAWRSVVSGANFMAVGLNFSGAAFFGGQIISSHGYPFYFSIAAVLSLASLAILAARFRSVPQ